MEGGSFVGQHFRLNVSVHFTEVLHLSDQFICTWNPRHKGGVVDNHIREDSSFSWLVKINTICREFYSIFNWAKTTKCFCKVEKFECPDEETNKLPDDKICQQCSFFIDQFAHRLLGSTASISECNS